MMDLDILRALGGIAEERVQMIAVRINAVNWREFLPCEISTKI